MKAVQYGILILLIAAAAAVGAQERAARVVVDKVFEKEIEKTNRIVGIVHFDKSSGISSEISGLIDRQDVIEGKVVKKGDVLIRLNTDLIRKTIEITQKRVELVEVKMVNTEKNLKRYEILFQKDAASEKAYDDLAGTYNELAKEKEILKQDIEKLRIEMNKSVIRAPFDGLILEKYKNEGEWVTPGAPICLLAAIDDVCVKVAVSEELIKYIRTGQTISIMINALDKEITGTVQTVLRIADIKSKTFPVKIAIPYFDQAIQNMSATVDAPVSNVMKLRMIQRDALVRFENKNFVYTVKDGIAKILPVNIVAYEGDYFGVDNPNIQAGMPVVVEGNDRLRPDTPVTVTE